MLRHQFIGGSNADQPASGSRATTGEPPAPSPVPGQQGSEAVLISLGPLSLSSAMDRHPLAAGSVAKDERDIFTATNNTVSGVHS